MIPRVRMLKDRVQSIQARVSLAIAIAAVAMGVAALLIYSATDRLASLPERLYQRPYKVGLALRDVRADLMIVQYSLQNLASAPTPLTLRRFKQKVQAADGRIASSLKVIDERFDSERALVSELRTGYLAWVPVRDAVVAEVEAGDAVAAYTLVKTEAVPMILDVVEDLDFLLTLSDFYAGTARSQNQALRRMTFGGVLIALLVGLSGLFILSFFLRRAVITPTTEISRAIRRIAEGELHHPIPFCNRPDEIGEIARSTKIFMDYALALKRLELDWLTGLASRDQLREHVGLLRTDPETQALPSALAYFDIDDFADTNDAFGRKGGDALLIHVAKVLRDHCRIGDFAARDTGDGFIMLILGMPDIEDVTRLAAEICIDISKGVDFEDQALRCSCSAGVVMCDPQEAVDELLLKAERALQQAQKNGRGSVEAYTEELGERLRHHRETLAGLNFALQYDELVPFFQPQIAADTGELAGFEALVRWNHPEQGVLSPWQFIDVAITGGLLSKLTDMMISKSLQQLADWRRRGFDVPRMSLNFAASDLGRAGFVDHLMLEVERAGLEPSDVCVELLETAMIEDAGEPVSRALDRLGQLGFKIELDDFGTGHAAISTLHLVKLSGIKIDRSFITNLDQNLDQQHLTLGILRISRALDIGTVAEGVESEAERDLLVKLGCDTIQGYWVSPPMSAADTTLWIEEYRPQPCTDTVAKSA
ncbi:MAG: EAL domain-containing protein [Pseudomonadota bacterium]